MIFAKFLRTPFEIEHLIWLPLCETLGPYYPVLKGKES